MKLHKAASDKFRRIRDLRTDRYMQRSRAIRLSVSHTQ